MLYNEKNEIESHNHCGLPPIFSVALLTVFVLAQNSDWGSISMLWWGSIAFLCFAFFVSCKGSLCIEGRYTGWLLSFFCICFLSYFWAVQQSLVMTTMKNMVVHIFVLILLRSMLQNQKRIEQVLLIVLFSVVINVVWLLFTNAEMFSEVSNSSADVIDRLGSEGDWNANMIGMMAAIAMMITLFFMKKNNNIFMKLLYTAILVLLVFVSLISGSRKALLMVLMGFCGFIFVTSKGKRLRAILLITAVVAILYYLVMEVSFFYSIIGWRVEGFLSSLTGVGKADGSSRLRAAFIEDAFRVWQDYPALGCGIDCYRTLNTVKKGMYAHNNYMELLADIGIIGTAIYYGAFLYCLVNFIKNKKKDLLTWLLMMIMLILLVTDYGCVSYNLFLNEILLMLMFSSITVQRNRGYWLKISLT